MKRPPNTLSICVLLGVVGVACVDSTSPPGLGPAVGAEAGAGDGGSVDAGLFDPGIGNSILGLTARGNIVRIGLGADGKEDDLGFPKFNGTELRNIGAIAKGGAGLYGIDYGAKSGSNIVKIELPGLNCTPLGADIDFRARVPQKEGLAFNGTTFYGSGQFGPVVALQLGGQLDEYILRQGNAAADDTQCTTPEDLFWSGGVLAAGSCASATQPENNGFWVWEYLFGKPGTTGQGGTLTDKSLKYKSPERILGLGAGAGGLVAVSAQRNLLVLSGTSFVVVRELKDTIVDLE